jgi:hypothetical protein
MLFILLACTPHLPPMSTVPTCAVRGEPIQWSALVCMWREGTDDVDAPQVRSCMATHTTMASDPCGFVTEAKRDICEIQAKYGGDARRCFADPARVPVYDGPALTLSGG